MTEAGDPIKAAEETAKAVQEVAKLGQEVIQVTREFGGFLNKTFGPAAVEAGKLLFERIREKRIENFLEFQEMVEKILSDRNIGFDTKPIPLNFGVPLIEQVSLEHDQLLKTMWAGLLANALDPTRETQPRKLFARIVASLDPLDARLLNFLASQGWELFDIHRHPQGQALRKDVGPKGFNVVRLAQDLSVPEAEIRTSLLTLFSLGCIVDESKETYESIGIGSAGPRVHDPDTIFRPTQLGFEIIEACESER